ncbi:MAG: radical SAM protein [Candidatus Omnitrophota bacterium]
MTKINTVKISRILNPTSIDLGEYVINPYMGCEYSCLYCYVRHNKVISKKKDPWGTYVDIRINSPKLLEKEILLKKPKCVLLGSTTECFQDVEKNYKITKQVLEILNRYGVYYNILTRSPYIKEYIDLLSKGFCKRIYFTINNITSSLKNKLEPKSPNFTERIQAINELLHKNINVTPYFSPILPWVSDLKGIFSKFPRASAVEFEGLNFRVGNIDKIIDSISSIYPELKEKYIRLLKDRDYYDGFWYNTKEDIKKEADLAKKDYHVYIHTFASYFENKYTNNLYKLKEVCLLI